MAAAAARSRCWAALGRARASSSSSCLRWGLRGPAWPALGARPELLLLPPRRCLSSRSSSTVYSDTGALSSFLGKPGCMTETSLLLCLKKVKGKTHTYYQVLIDARDCPHISQRSQTEAVTFLANHDDSRALYAIPGLDYVSHEDILPYTSTDQVPIQHELFERFLLYDQTKAPPFVARDTLCAWQEKNHPWLELSDVHRETTENIRVTVIPFYMGMREAQNSHVYWWRYCIRLENLNNEVVQLRERHWRIFSLSGTLETVRGRGVVGREPVLSKEQPAFQYSSHV
ncbi:hypothetical protein E2320_018012, partial [Naja naja]